MLAVRLCDAYLMSRWRVCNLWQTWREHFTNDALQQDMFDAVVNDSTVHPATRAHFHATRQLGAGAVLGIDLISPATELHDRAWLYEAQGYLNHPKGAITLATH